MILLLAVIILAILGLVLVDAAVAQRQRERSLSTRIAMLRSRARPPLAYVPPPPANDAVPPMAVKIRRRADRLLGLRR